MEILERTVIELNKKVESKEQLEKVLHALTRKVLSLEREMNEIKIKYKSVENETNENCVTKEGSFNHNDIEGNSSTPKVTKEKIQKVQTKDELLTCIKCDYKCKKPST